jgi:hypothetical protein
MLGDRASKAGAELMQMGLVVVEDQQSGWISLGDLPGDLRADRTAGSCDEDATAGEEPVYRFEVGDDLFASQQVFDSQVAHVMQRNVALDKFGDTAEHAQRDLCQFGEICSSADQLDRRIGNGEHGLVDRCVASYSGQVGDRADHRHTQAVPTVHSRVVVEHGDRDQTSPRAPQHLADERSARFARAKDNNPKARLIALLSPQGE